MQQDAEPSATAGAGRGFALNQRDDEADREAQAERREVARGGGDVLPLVDVSASSADYVKEGYGGAAK